MSIGIVIGGNYSRYNNSYNQFKKENNFVLRKKIGILHEAYDPNAMFSVEYGLLFDQKGNKYTFEDFVDKVFTNFDTRMYTHYSKLNYLTIPILIKKSFGEYNNRIIISMGAYYSKMINYREIYKPKHPYFDDYKSALFKKEGYYKSGDFGISAGIGKQFNNIQINFNYYKSIRNIHVINTYNHDVIKPVSLELSLKLMI
jgi:hypothetical protein